MLASVRAIRDRLGAGARANANDTARKHWGSFFRQGRIRIGYLGTGAGNRICAKTWLPSFSKQLEDDQTCTKLP